jgi:hypothetical protein
MAGIELRRRLNSWNLNDRGGRIGSVHWRKES